MTVCIHIIIYNQCEILLEFENSKGKGHIVKVYLDLTGGDKRDEQAWHACGLVSCV